MDKSDFQILMSLLVEIRDRLPEKDNDREKRIKYWKDMAKHT